MDIRESSDRRALVQARLVLGLVVVATIVALGWVVESRDERETRGAATSAVHAAGGPEVGRGDRGSGMVGVAGPTGSEPVGYIRAADLESEVVRSPRDVPKSGLVEAPTYEVWDETGTDLLGHFYQGGVGFLTLAAEDELGVSPDHPPTPRSEPTVISEETGSPRSGP